jgi:hypothetical protein
MSYGLSKWVLNKSCLKNIFLRGYSVYKILILVIIQMILFANLGHSKTLTFDGETCRPTNGSENIELCAEALYRYQDLNIFGYLIHVHYKNCPVTLSYVDPEKMRLGLVNKNEYAGILDLMGLLYATEEHSFQWMSIDEMYKELNSPKGLQGKDMPSCLKEALSDPQNAIFSNVMYVYQVHYENLKEKLSLL